MAKLTRLGRSLKPMPISINEPAQASDGSPEYYLNILLQSCGEDNQSDNYEFRYLPHHSLFPNPDNPRKNFLTEDLEDLATSIRSAGRIIQPLVVVRARNNRYMIVSGERRWRAADLIDLNEIPCLIASKMDEKTVSTLSLIENMQREDLSPLEEATGIFELIQKHGMTHQQAANAVGKSRTHVTNLLRLLNLEAEVQSALSDKTIDMGHARVLAGLEPKDQVTICRLIIKHGWSVRQTENAVRRFKQDRAGEGAPISSVRKYDPERLRDLALRFSEIVGGDTNIRVSADGKVSLRVDSLDRLESLLRKLALDS